MKLEIRVWDFTVEDWLEDPEDHTLRSLDDQECSVDLSTGLLDIHGEPMFERDIVRNHTDFNVEVHGHYVDYEIVYRSGMWILSYLRSEKGQKLPKGYTSGSIEDFLELQGKLVYFKDYPQTRLEKIGNMYEDPPED